MRQIHRHALRIAIALAAAAGVTLFAADRAEAGCSPTKKVTLDNGKTRMEPRVGKAERALGGKVWVSTKEFPTHSSSVGAYISRVKSMNETKFWEDKSKKQWRIYFAAYFTKPLDDLEVVVKLYDVTDGEQRVVSSFDQYFEDRCETSYISDMKLDREHFGVNRKIVMIVEEKQHHTKIATGKFEILGEAEKYSGKAVFSDEDTQEPGEKKPPPEPPPADLPPEKDPEVDKPLDLDDPKYDSPDLDPTQGFNDSKPQQPHSNRGCGCRADGGGGAASGLLLLGLVGLGLRRRRR